MSRKEWCKHYRGMQHDTCRADVVYETVKLKHDKGVSLPCWGEDANPFGVKCDKCEYPTPEEVDAMRVKTEKRFEALGKCREAIVMHLGGPWKRGTPGAAGKIICPVCEKLEALSFTRSGYNGHIHARCANGCASWME